MSVRQKGETACLKREKGEKARWHSSVLRRKAPSAMRCFLFLSHISSCQPFLAVEVGLLCFECEAKSSVLLEACARPRVEARKGRRRDTAVCCSQTDGELKLHYSSSHGDACT